MQETPLRRRQTYLRGILSEDCIKVEGLWGCGGGTASLTHSASWRLADGQLLLMSVHLQEGHGLRRVLFPFRWTDTHHYFHL